MQPIVLIVTCLRVPQGVCSSLLRLHTLRPRPPRLAWLAGELENAAKSTIADFRYKDKMIQKL
jgi:hypothetical protein